MSMTRCGRASRRRRTRCNAEADEILRCTTVGVSADRRDTRARHYERKLETKADEVKLRLPKVRSLPFETAIVERYRRREASVRFSKPVPVAVLTTPDEPVVIAYRATFGSPGSQVEPLAGQVTFGHFRRVGLGDSKESSADWVRRSLERGVKLNWNDTMLFSTRNAHRLDEVVRILEEIEREGRA